MSVLHKELDSIIHAPLRLQIMMLLSQVEQCDFAYLKSATEASDGNLSAHLSKLEEAQYIVIHKSFKGRRQHTEVQISSKGNRSLNAYLKTLKSLIA